MAEFAQVTVTPEELTVNPGGQAQAAVFLRNNSNVVDVFTLEVEGLDEAWTDFSVSSVSMFPGDSGNSTLTISVPKASDSSAGTYDFGVKVTSRKDPSDNIVIQCKLIVTAYHGLEASLNPQRAEGISGKYIATLTNTGNQGLNVSLKATDTNNACSFTYSQQSPNVPAGESVDVTITVVSGQRPLRGASLIHSITMAVAPPPNTAPAVSLYATLQVPPRLPRWAIPAAIGAAVILVGIIALAIVLSRGGDEPQPTAPIVVTEPQPLNGAFDFVPGKERSFDILVQEPGFLLVQVQWEVTGNGMEIRIEATDTDTEFLQELSIQGLDIILLNEDLTEPIGEYQIPIQDAFANRALHVRLRNGTPNDTNGNFSIRFLRQLPNSPTPTATVIPTLTATTVPTPSPLPTVTTTPLPTAIPKPSPRPTQTATPTPKPRRLLKLAPVNANLGRFEVVPQADFDGRYEDGTTVRITAIPARNCTFRGWAGSITESSSVIKFEMNEDISLEGRFICLLLVPTPTRTPVIFFPVTPIIRRSPVISVPNINLIP